MHEQYLTSGKSMQSLHLYTVYIYLAVSFTLSLKQNKYTGLKHILKYF